MGKKLAIITTHPIQYYAPVFQLLARQLQLKVFYTWGEDSLNKFDKGFGQEIEWDLPLLKGYEYSFLKNTASNKGTHHFKGIVNPTLNKEIKDYNPDAILIYGWAWHSHLKAMRFFKGKIPVYFRGDSTLLNNQQKLKAFFRSAFLKWAYRNIDVAFCVGTASKAYFEKYGLEQSQLIVAPHAIDNKRFAAIQNEEAEKLRIELGIKNDEILILFAGKLEPVKNPLLLLDAFKSIKKVNIHLLFVGNGILEENLKSESKDLKNVHFINFQNQTQMPAIYQACNLFCLPSISETWGLAVNEAMAAAKAILISTRVGCATDLVKPSINGQIFESGNVDDLIRKLTELTNSKEKLTQMGIVSQQIIQAWSFENQVKVMVDTFYNNHAK
ncbi:Mannosylfructose-phosphate synthase [Pedobacter sp. Bi27]|uniref:glycosyltransferase family 4 protein n=1 Tax=Pedobacter sp. Bi27 TaxID=2822351 RepID=UPI001DDF3367|nr:glycosyltransferase family 4 protein [Pedobacter sp. Bi27]CAH0167575.1 Mannosylfructose-phosphate synthase [Pedobacter sp. Bi27]